MTRVSLKAAQRDLMALLFCIVLVGVLFFLAFLLFYDRRGKTAKKLFDIFFITINSHKFAF